MEFIELVEKTNLKLLMIELSENVEIATNLEVDEDVKDAIISIKNKEKLGKIQSELLKDIDNDEPKNIFNLSMF